MFVALILGLVLVAAGVTAGLLLSKKAKIEARISNRILHAESRMKRPMTKEEMKAWRLKTFCSRKQASP